MKIYADGADRDTILKLNANPLIEGFTTNPTLMRKAGVQNYEKFAKEILTEVKKPISFEVFSDDFDEMERQARIISSWGENVYVKIPITNTKGESSIDLIDGLWDIKLNITAITDISQIKELPDTRFLIVSIFAGRIADTGRDPIPFMKYAR